ncbi:MAG: Holliday junction resolvase RuvX [Xanthomonadales bacterium]|jgi:putative Holliday junction resolvase|nr:Holliday junction resolvase RuvX [Xanthomonadales bacterium]MBK7146302.1 Holliday junction resolvase RuvX [Xanthomonadales bacterium]MCC6563151.1 Holliday junction resolvase RuvX [Xanthomonadales bacterium]
MPEATVVLGFDYGLRRIGVAVGQRITHTASALAVMRNHESGPDWAACDALIKTWRPQALVVGLPLARDGHEQAMTHAARAFAALLRQRYAVPVHLADERFTSRAADAEFVAARRAGLARRKDAAMLDAQAARRIVEQWLHHPQTESAPA